MRFSVAHVGAVRNHGPVTTYGVSDMVIDRSSRECPLGGSKVEVSCRRGQIKHYANTSSGELSKIGNNSAVDSRFVQPQLN